jgi:hypothetical protein
LSAAYGVDWLRFDHRRKPICAILGRNIMLRPLIFSAAAAAALAVSTPSFAETIQVGILECAGGPSVGYLIGSSAGLNCVFRPSTRRGAEGYAGQMNRLGLDVGYTTGTGLGWAVFAPSRNLTSGALAGHYGGVSANAAVLVGGGANVLVGGLNNSITLQPVSLQGQTGLNVAATATGVDLQPVARTRAVVVKKKKSTTRT